MRADGANRYQCPLCGFVADEPGHCPFHGGLLVRQELLASSQRADERRGHHKPRRSRDPAETTCIDEEQLKALAMGRVSAVERRLLDRHLDACDHCRELQVRFSAVAAAAGENDDATYSSDPMEQAVGRDASGRYGQFGHFEILETLGSGAMGVVYRARDRRDQREVALKLASAGSSLPAGLQMRLRREGHMLSRVDHPNVVRVLDVGLQGDQVYVAMELVTGQNLRSWLTARARTVSEVLDVFLQAARGLEAAHSAGVLHRDFKPTNVLIEESGRVRVMDFGLARLGPGHEAQLTIEKTLTQEGVMLGTPGYMSPEQLSGLPVDETADQYSFCAALFESLYGRRPYQGHSPKALRIAAAKGQISFPVRPGVDRDLEGVLWRGLRPKPGDRYASVAALIADLERVRAAIA